MQLKNDNKLDFLYHTNLAAIQFWFSSRAFSVLCVEANVVPPLGPTLVVEPGIQCGATRTGRTTQRLT